MIKPNSDLASLLAAAIDLAHAPTSATPEIIRIGASRFRLMTEYHASAGWAVVLVEVPRTAMICEEDLCGYGLTNREAQVARLLAERLSNKEIAEILNVTVHTAGRHTEGVLRKLGVASRREVRDKVMTARASN